MSPLGVAIATSLYVVLGKSLIPTTVYDGVMAAVLIISAAVGSSLAVMKKG